MPIDLDCPNCGRVLRVADKYAGRRGKCPACGESLQIPEDNPVLEILPEDRRTYDNVIIPPPPPRVSPEELAARKALGEKFAADKQAPVTYRDPRLVRLDKLKEQEDAKNAPPWWNREFLNVFGLALTPVWLLLIPIALAGAGWWWATGPGKPALVQSVSPVFVVEVLATGETQKPFGSAGAGNLTWGSASATGGTGAVTQYTSPTGGPESKVFSVGGNDGLIVTQADPGGDFVMVEVALKQGIINNLGQTSGYDSVIKAGEFELRRLGEPHGSGEKSRLVTAHFDQPIDIDLAGAQTSNPGALLPPDPAPDRRDDTKIPGVLNGEAEYALGITQGEISYTASLGVQGYPPMPGLTATGKLVTTHPDRDGPQVTADYRGGSLNVSWNRDARAHWVEPKIVEATLTSPFDRYTFSLLFPRPDDPGTYALSFAGRDVATVKLARAPQPSAPAPNPIASRRPGGPQAASKNANSPLAYFDVLRDAKSQAQGVVSANNMRQIGLGLQMYMDANRGAFPESLMQLRGFMPQLDQLMVNPRTGDRPGFIYEKPAPGAPPGSTPVLYESLGGQKDPEGAILYGDGSIR